MKYRVIWHDREDERSGAPIEVEAASPIEAHHLAMEKLKSIAHMFEPVDIECLVDQGGKYLHPQFYLPARPSGGDDVILNSPDNLNVEVTSVLGDAICFAFNATVISPDANYADRAIEVSEGRQRAAAALSFLRDKGFRLVKISK